MKTPAIWTQPNTTAVSAAQLMIKKNVGSLLLIKEERLTGMITRTDLLKAVSY